MIPIGAILSIALPILAQLPDLIAKAEAAFSGKPGSGQAKKDLVMNTVKQGIGIAQQVNPALITPDHAAMIVNSASQLTDTIVATVNTVKALSATSAPPSPAAPPAG